MLEFVYRAPDLRVLIMPWMGYDKPIDWSKVSRHLEELYLYRRTISAAELEAIRSFPRLRVLQLIDCVADSKLGRGLPLNAPRPAENWNARLEELVVASGDYFLTRALTWWQFPELREITVSLPFLHPLSNMKQLPEWQRCYPKLRRMVLLRSAGLYPSSQQEKQVIADFAKKSLERWAGWLPEEADCELVLRIAATSAR